jgi:hypothetical protein
MLFLESYSCIKFNSISGCGQDATRVCDFIFLKTMCICKQACAALFSDSAYQFEYFSAMLLLSLQVNASGQFCGVAEMAGDTADTAASKWIQYCFHVCPKDNIVLCFK